MSLDGVRWGGIVSVLISIPPITPYTSIYHQFIWRLKNLAWNIDNFAGNQQGPNWYSLLSRLARTLITCPTTTLTNEFDAWDDKSKIWHAGSRLRLVWANHCWYTFESDKTRVAPRIRSLIASKMHVNYRRRLSWYLPPLTLQYYDSLLWIYDGLVQTIVIDIIPTTTILCFGCMIRC